MLKIIYDDNLPVLKRLSSNSIDLIYIDPPFNTGKQQQRTQIQTVRDEQGDRVGFQDRRYRTEVVGQTGYEDRFTNYHAFLEERFKEAKRLLSSTGSFFLHIDYREVHYCKVILDQIFGRECFMNEIIWAYDFGGRPKSRWPAKHDNILWYVNDPKNYTYHYDEIDRIPYMSPNLVGPEKAKKGKTPTDVWWQTVVPTNSKEKTNYATQKPLKIIERIVKVHSSTGDQLLDFFAGSGTLGEAAYKHDRDCTLVDNNPDAIQIMAERLGKANPEFENCEWLTVDKQEKNESEFHETPLSLDW